eukprot:COSAG04_NODE_11794_length_688_cov_1.033956_1_plen_79_part_00
MATASGDAAVKIWSVTDYTCLKTFDGHDASVLKVCFCSAGMQLLSTGKLPTITNSDIIFTLSSWFRELTLLVLAARRC